MCFFVYVSTKVVLTLRGLEMQNLTKKKDDLSTDHKTHGGLQALAGWLVYVPELQSKDLYDTRVA